MRLPCLLVTDSTLTDLFLMLWERVIYVFAYDNNILAILSIGEVDDVLSYLLF